MRWLKVAGVLALAVCGVGVIVAQESNAAKTTRKKLQQKVTVDFKDEGTKAVIEQVFGEMDKAPKFKIDNASGVSNNTKLTYKAKDKSVEQILNDISDKLDCGWYVVSNAANNKVDGSVVIRKNTKGKERGYEAGKEPKEK